ncbi:MAG: flagellar motor protein MotB [Rhodospirillaceae bacterium]
MGAPVKGKPVEEAEDWMTTYADAITLLMCFFVMMLTFAEYNMPAFEEAAAAIKDKIGGSDTASPTEKLKIDVEDVVFQMQADQAVKVTKDSKGVVIELASNAFYKPGTAELNEAAIPALEKIAKTIAAPRYATYNITIEGHTDDEPIKTQMFPSNWELSTARAARVVRFFAEGDFVAPLKLSAAGFADQKPKVPNRDAEGNPIPENRATNRRTTLRINSMSLKEREVWFQYLAEKRAKEEEMNRAQAATGVGQPAQQPQGQAGTPAGQGQPAQAPADGQAAAGGGIPKGGSVEVQGQTGGGIPQGGPVNVQPAAPAQ